MAQGLLRRSMYNGSTGKEHDIRKNWACAKDQLKGVPYALFRQLIGAEQGLKPFVHLAVSRSDTFTEPRLFEVRSHSEIASNVQIVGSEPRQRFFARKCWGSRGAYDACC